MLEVEHTPHEPHIYYEHPSYNFLPSRYFIKICASMESLMPLVAPSFYLALPHDTG